MGRVVSCHRLFRFQVAPVITRRNVEPAIPCFSIFTVKKDSEDHFLA